MARLESAPDAADKPKVLIYDSGEEDLYTSGGNGAPNGIIDAAGGTNVFADVDNTWFKASWETVAKSEPDVIVIMDYKKSADEVQGKIDAIKSREGLRDLDAVKQNRFVVLPLAMFTSGFPNIYGAEQLRAKIEEFGLAPSSSIDWDNRAVGMSNNRCSRRVIVVLRPTVSGLDESAARRMFDAVRGRHRRRRSYCVPRCLLAEPSRGTRSSPCR